jgi:outer membrane receptor for ferrienterochelin and colicins
MILLQSEQRWFIFTILKSELSILLNPTSAGGMDASGFSSGMTEPFGTTLFTSYDSSEAYDPADNSVSAISEFERWTFNPRLFSKSNLVRLILV